MASKSVVERNINLYVGMGFILVWTDLMFKMWVIKICWQKFIFKRRYVKQIEVTVIWFKLISTQFDILYPWLIWVNRLPENSYVVCLNWQSTSYKPVNSLLPWGDKNLFGLHEFINFLLTFARLTCDLVYIEALINMNLERGMVPWLWDITIDVYRLSI